MAQLIDIDKLKILIECELDEDFPIVINNNNIIIKLVGNHFKNQGNMIISSDRVIYQEANKEYIKFIVPETYSVYGILENWLEENSPIGNNDFKKFFS